MKSLSFDDQVRRLEELARLLLSVGLTVATGAAGLIAATDAASDYTFPILVGGICGAISSVSAGTALDIYSEDADSLLKKKKRRTRIALFVLLIGTEVAAGLVVLTALDVL